MAATAVDISDLPAPPNAVDISDLPAPVRALDVAQAGSSGFNAGVADLAGLPMDTAANVVDIGKAIIGSGYQAVTGHPVPSALEIGDRSTVPGTSEWIKRKTREAGAADLIDVTGNPDSKVLKYTHAGFEAVPGAAADQPTASLPTVARRVVGAAAAGEAQQGVADAGGGTASQAAAGFIGGHLANAAASPRAPRAPKAPETVAEPPTKPGGFTAEDLMEKPQEASAAAASPAPAEAPVAPAVRSEGQAPRNPGPVAGAAQTGEGIGGSGSPVRGSNGPKPASVNLGNEGRAPADTVGPKGAPEAVEFTPPEKEGGSRAALPAKDQETRAQVLRDVGLTETRHSAVTGDTKETGTDFQTSKLTNGAGNRMSDVLRNERETLRDYADGLIHQSGGSTGMDQATRHTRGERITAPIEALDKALEVETKKHYQIADQRAAGSPIELNAVHNLMQNERAAFLGTVEGKQLFEGVQARMDELGLAPGKPGTVAQAERLRQYLNDNWSPRTSRLIGALKDHLDADVTKAAGADIYASGRQVRALRATHLEDPKGVSKLLAPDDRLGINRQVGHEDVGHYVARLGADQFGQVVNVLKRAGKDSAIAPKAATALNEIRAHFASELKDRGDSTQGMWNAKAVNKYLQDNNANMSQVFTPDEMRRFKTLNDAGNILKMDRTYPGAAAQGHTFVQKGLTVVGKHAEGAGALLGHIPGAIVGATVGKGVEKLTDKSALANVEKRIRGL